MESASAANSATPRAPARSERTAAHRVDVHDLGRADRRGVGEGGGRPRCPSCPSAGRRAREHVARARRPVAGGGPRTSRCPTRRGGRTIGERAEPEPGAVGQERARGQGARPRRTNRSDWRCPPTSKRTAVADPDPGLARPCRSRARARPGVRAPARARPAGRRAGCRRAAAVGWPATDAAVNASTSHDRTASGCAEIAAPDLRPSGSRSRRWSARRPATASRSGARGRRRCRGSRRRSRPRPSAATATVAATGSAMRCRPSATPMPSAIGRPHHASERAERAPAAPGPRRSRRTARRHASATITPPAPTTNSGTTSAVTRAGAEKPLPGIGACDLADRADRRRERSPRRARRRAAPMPSASSDGAASATSRGTGRIPSARRRAVGAAAARRCRRPAAIPATTTVARSATAAEEPQGDDERAHRVLHPLVGVAAGGHDRVVETPACRSAVREAGG